MTQNRKTKSNKDQIPKSIIVAGILVVLLILGWLFGIVPYTVKYIECGNAPATISPGIAGASTKPELPGEDDYGPGIFKKYICVDETYLNDTYPR